MAVNRWTEDETKRSLYLYFQLTFGQLHSGNSEIVALAQALGRTPSSIAMKLANFASLDPKITSTGRKGLVGATALDRQIWAEFNSDWTRLVTDAETLALSDLPSGNVKEGTRTFVHKPFVGSTSIMAVVEQRVGQNFFRRAVLANYDNRCCVTGIADTRLLNASHIMPWSADEKNRHNPQNGLCLSATFDRAFDRGLIQIPTLYERLYKYSGGPTANDHSWHEFIELSDNTTPKQDDDVWGTTEMLLSKFRLIRKWDVRLSAHSTIV